MTTTYSPSTTRNRLIYDAVVSTYINDISRRRARKRRARPAPVAHLRAAADRAA
jgi:hypothetical protein